MNNISAVDNCVNCGSCFNSCPVSAITINTNDIFYYPTVDNEKCVNCGRCLDHCPMYHPICANSPKVAFGGWSKDVKLVLESSSGGLFGELAKNTIDEGGVVFGSVYDDQYKSVCVQSTENVDLKEIQKSKYVESFIGDSFREIKEIISTGRQVLFCATPCQIAGLKSYLGKDYDNLLTCDFACGGLPSHAIFKEYISNLEKKYRSKVAGVDFRPKTYGWIRHSVLIRFENGKAYSCLGINDEYMRSFIYGKLSVRDNCLNCVFADKHVSDISLADFWMYQKISQLKNDDGISLVLCNTDKGIQAIKSIDSRVELTRLELDKACYNNVPASVSFEKVQRHDAFIKAFMQKGLSKACKEINPQSFSDIIKNYIFTKRFKKRKNI